MLADILNTNEVKDASAAEVEFSRRLTDGATTEFKRIAEVPNLPHRVAVKHTESGKGEEARRRSLVQVNKFITGVSGKPRLVQAHVVVNLPVGDVATDTEAKNVLAELGSLVFTNATSTFLYDGTGNGAKCLLNGDL